MPAPSRVYFLQGHNEHEPTDSDDQMGYLQFTRMLQDEQMTVVKLSPTALLTRDVPADCQLLVIANPTNPLAAEEVEKIEKYLGAGGRIFLLLSRNSIKEVTGLESLLAAGASRWAAIPFAKPPRANRMIRGR